MWMCFMTFMCTSSIAKAQAAPLRVQILDFTSIEGDDPFSRALSMAIRMALMDHEGLQVSESSITLQQMRLANNCEDSSSLPPVDCYVRMAHLLDADILVTGLVQRSSGDETNFDYMVSAEVFNVREARISATVAESFPQSEANSVIVNRVRSLVARLITDLDVSHPGAADDVSPPPSVASHDEPDQVLSQNGSSVNPLQVIGWSLIGGGAIATGFMIGSWVLLNDLQNDADYMAYRMRIPSNVTTGDVCQEASANRNWWNASSGITREEAVRQTANAGRICSSASAWEVSQYVFMAAGLGFTAVGIALLVLDMSSGNNSMSLRPSVGPRHAFLEVSTSF